MPKIEPRYILRKLLETMIEQAEVMYQRSIVPYYYDIRLNEQDFKHVDGFSKFLKREAINVLNEQFNTLSRLQTGGVVASEPPTPVVTPPRPSGFFSKAARWFEMETIPEPSKPSLEPSLAWKEDPGNLFPTHLFERLKGTTPFRTAQFYVQIAPNLDVAEGTCVIEIFFDPGDNQRSTILLYEVDNNNTPPKVKGKAKGEPTVIQPKGSGFVQGIPQTDTPYAEVVLVHPKAGKPITLKKQTSFGRKKGTPAADIDLRATQNISGIHFLIRYNPVTRQAEIKDMSHAQLHTWVNGTVVTPSRDDQKGDLDIWYPLPDTATIHAGFDKPDAEVSFRLLAPISGKTL